MALPYSFKEIEPEILKFWEKSRIYAKAKNKNKGKESFYFLDGPPYTSGKVHVGTAWNKALKDMVLRYKRMRGFDVWDRAGYDMHGLPTEHATMKKLGLKSKEDILKFGMKKFIAECRKLCIENMEGMNREFIREGVWMDFENAYQSIKKEFIESEWWLVKKAHEKGRLYEGLRTNHWCPGCASALAKHELEYQEVKDTSIFLKFKVKSKDNEFLIIWTTTPWTIPFNLAVMVNPELEYVRAKVENEVWVVAKALAGPLIQAVANKQFEIIEEFTGDKLEGTEYIHPLYDDLKEYYDRIKKKSAKAFTVLLSTEYVDTSAGSGLVHMAPGCGPEDYEVGHRNGIEPFNLLDERGYFDDNTVYKGLRARADDSKFTERFREKGFLIETTEVEHDYAHCQRCKAPVVYRTTKQWFFKVEDLKKKMIAENKKISWVPEAAFNAFNSWLENLRDNSITKQRFWGTPLPVWKCDKCGDYDVFGSEAELKKAAGKAPKDLHKPDIDEIAYKCKKCNGIKQRIPDILDVWVDAGTVSWNCLDYPQRKDLFNKLFPADFILEGKDQIRGWFNLLMVASMVALDKPSFKSVYMHGFVNDSQGRKMSKSQGNYILPAEVCGKYGADTFRYYTIGGANPGFDLNYNFEDVSLKYKNLVILWNIHNFLLDICKNNSINPAKLKLQKKLLGREEKYILSKLNSTIREVTDIMEHYHLNEVPLKIESLFLELSRTYIQFTRNKSSTGSKQDKEIVACTVYNVLMEALKMFAIVAPFITEKIYLNLKEDLKLKKDSIHHYGWPSFDESSINPELEADMDAASRVLQALHAAREKAQISSRWPLQQAIIVSPKLQKSVEKTAEIIMAQSNIKDISVKSSFPLVKTAVKADFSQLGPDFGSLAPKIVAALAKESAESILSHIQKESKFELIVDNKKVNIVKEHLIVERQVPPDYVEAEFPGGFVYLYKKMTPELEAEGYAREVMRRIQSLRKKQGLERKDRITLFIKVDEEMEEMLKPWHSAIKEKVGASAMHISTNEPAKKHKVVSKEKVKDRCFEVMVDVV